jgi:SAM-dependent methyltransferase
VEQAEVRHERLVEVYDAVCPWSRDDDWFVRLVEAEGPARRVLDLGCGTGRLALGLASLGHRVTGVDPAAASLAAARGKPGAERVDWIEGTVTSASDAAFDVALMTSHVAQLFVADDAWGAVLAGLRRAVVPGGLVAFDSRDPRARAWDGWNGADTYRHVALVRGRRVRTWTQLTDADEGIVSFAHHYRFDDGVTLRSDLTLRFRSEDELRRSLDAGGFAVERIAGGWAGEPVGHPDGELLVVARRR